jgi:phosphoserine aminotransferase
MRSLQGDLPRATLTSSSLRKPSMTRVHNFNAGPAALPLSVLQRAQAELLEFESTGMSIMEHSHRGKAYDAVHTEAIELVRELLGVSDDYDILFLQGGASQQFAVVPMNLLPTGRSADYVITGVWGKKALKEATIVGNARVACDTAVDGVWRRVPRQEELSLDPAAAYVHITTNNTVAGTQWHTLPDVGDVPLVADMSSDILSRPLDVSRFGLIYAGAQKNLGPSGVTLVIVRKDLVESARTDIPTMFQYRTHASSRSLYNTPPTFGIYMLRNVLQWVKEQGGAEAIERTNRAKADALYAVLAERPDFYRLPVEVESRSLMNVVWNLPTPELEAECVQAAAAAGLVGLKGHRLVGGLRASIYNAVSLESVHALCDFLRAFRK